MSRLLGGRYRLGALLGRGGAATVHQGVDIVLGRPVAIKLYQAMDNPTGLHRFAAEARLLASLSHPGLVTVYDVSLEDDQPYLVMQLINGPSLRELLDPGPFEPRAVARMGARLARVLAYIHARDVIHRDIKPSNVLVDESGAFHLADFGIARALSTAHLTASGEFVGTAAYLAPEQVTDVDVGPPVDIYALGLLLLECLTGRTEYTGTTVESALARLSRPPRIPDTLPTAWRTVLTAMTAQDPAARPDAARCDALLVTIAENKHLTVPADLVLPHPRPPADEPAPAPSPSGPSSSRRGRLSRARLRPMHAGLAVTALAAAVTVAATTTSAVAGHPTSEPRQTQPSAISEEAQATRTASFPPSQGTPSTPVANNPAHPAPRDPTPTAAAPAGTPVVPHVSDKGQSNGNGKGQPKSNGKGAGNGKGEQANTGNGNRNGKGNGKG